MANPYLENYLKSGGGGGPAPTPTNNSFLSNFMARSQPQPVKPLSGDRFQKYQTTYMQADPDVQANIRAHAEKMVKSDPNNVTFKQQLLAIQRADQALLKSNASAPVHEQAGYADQLAQVTRQIPKAASDPNNYLAVAKNTPVIGPITEGVGEYANHINEIMRLQKRAAGTNDPSAKAQIAKQVGEHVKAIMAVPSKTSAKAGMEAAALADPILSALIVAPRVVAKGIAELTPGKKFAGQTAYSSDIKKNGLIPTVVGGAIDAAQLFAGGKEAAGFKSEASVAAKEAEGVKTAASAASTVAPKITKTTSIADDINRPGALKPVKTPSNLPVPKTAPGTPQRSVVEKVFNFVTGGKANGAINPSRAAAREGNVELAKAAQENAAAVNVRSYSARLTSGQLKDMLKGQDVNEFNRLVESGEQSDNPQLQKAVDFFRKNTNKIGAESLEAGTIKSFVDNYLPHVAKGIKTDGTGNIVGKFSKSPGGFKIGRETIALTDETGKTVQEFKYKTVSAFDQAMRKLGGYAEQDPSKLLGHLLKSEGTAIENAKTIERMKNISMTDGRPASLPLSAIEDKLSRGYEVRGAALIHPDATKVYDAIAKPGKIPNEFGAAVAKANSIGRRVVTVSGLAHGLNEIKSSVAGQGALRTIWSLVTPGAKNEDIIRALANGTQLAKANTHNLYDEFGKQGFLAKLSHPMDKLIFEGIGDKLGMSTYLKVEKSALRHGLPAEEAGKVAADAANKVLLKVPADQESLALKQAGQLTAFSTQMLHNTGKALSNAIGVGLDKTLSSAGQLEQQKVAIGRIVRYFSTAFLAAQAINYHATGHFTWQNRSNDKISPIWYTDPKSGKSYTITNHYGQLGDIIKFFMNAPAELGNKMAPGAKEIAEQLAGKNGTDFFTGKSIAQPGDHLYQQIAERLIHAANSMFQPGGFQLSSPTPRQPLAVEAGKLAGVTSSSAASKPAAQQFLQDFYDRLGLPNYGGNDIQKSFDGLPTQAKLDFLKKASPAQKEGIDTHKTMISLTNDLKTGRFKANEVQPAKDLLKYLGVKDVSAGSDQIKQLLQEGKAQRHQQYLQNKAHKGKSKSQL